MLAGTYRAECGGERSGSVPASIRRARNRVGVGSTAATPCEDGAVSTRTLLVLAALTGLAILVAGAVQILLAR